MNEFDFINKYFKPLVSKEARNLNDDAAIFRPKLKNEIVISTDSLVERAKHIADIISVD